jgi:predicted transposase/invertase (TIGR01784 family)
MDTDIKKVEERLEYLSSDDKTIEIYKSREKSLHERANMINGAKEEGIKEGIKEGIITTAKNLLVMGMDLDMVSKATGLSMEKVTSLKH